MVLPIHHTSQSTREMCLLRLTFIFLVFVLKSGLCHEEKPPKLLLISFDGFRHDYLQRANLPNFEAFKKEGVYAKSGLKNVYITKTFPNHYTLVTGLYEESHGIVGNTMFDPVLNETFDLYTNPNAARDPRWFDVGAEPIWVTSQLQNCEHRSGVMMWPGCEAPVKGVLPTRYLAFNPKMSNYSRVDQIVRWFNATDYPINLGLLYFEQPDEIGHAFGASSVQVVETIEGLDKVLGYLMSELEKNKLLDDMNIIVTSDHGMADAENNITLDNFVDPTLYRIFQSDPVANILPNNAHDDQVYQKLKDGAKANGHFRVYRKEEIPAEYHYQQNRRIMPIVLEAELHYQFVYNGSSIPKGTHGYNNSLPEMHPLFLARGPSFKKGAMVETFNSLDLYPLMCHLMHLKAAPNNGSMATVSELLREEEENTITTFGTYIFVLIVIALVAGVFMVAACRQHRYMKRLGRPTLTSLHGGVQYSLPPSNEAKVPLLSDTDEEETIH